MRKQLFLCVFAALLLLLSGCQCQHEWSSGSCEDPVLCEKCGEAQGEPLGHSFGKERVLAEPYQGQAGQKAEVCSICAEAKTEEYPAAELFQGETFTLTPREFHERLAYLGGELSESLTVDFEENDGNVFSLLRYRGEAFCEVWYTDLYGTDPTAGSRADVADIRRLTVVDYLAAEHAPNCTNVILMTADPLLLEEDAKEIEQRLTQRFTWDREMDTAICTHNNLAYGYSMQCNQMVESASVFIRPALHTDEVLSQPECAHEWEKTVDVYGVAGQTCIFCGALEAGAQDWVPLSTCYVLGSGNPGGGQDGEDIARGDWTSFTGVEYPDSLKFWVSGKPGMSEREYIKFRLEEGREILSGILQLSSKSEADSSAFIRIYLDNEQVFESRTLSEEEDSDSFILEVGDAETVLIECITRGGADAHCILAAALCE